MGYDIAHMETNSRDECSAQCCENRECIGFDWLLENGMCYLSKTSRKQVGLTTRRNTWSCEKRNLQNGKWFWFGRWNSHQNHVRLCKYNFIFASPSALDLKISWEKRPSNYRGFPDCGIRHYIDFLRHLSNCLVFTLYLCSIVFLDQRIFTKKETETHNKTF